jgi:hypothetical protein
VVRGAGSMGWRYCSGGLAGPAQLAAGLILGASATFRQVGSCCCPQLPS